MSTYGKGGEGGKGEERIEGIVIMGEFILSGEKIICGRIDGVKEGVVSLGMIEGG